MTERSPQIEDEIVQAVSEGKPLAQICRELNIGRRTVYDWQDADAAFAARIARARELGFDAIADDCLKIADDTDEDPASRRVRTDTRLKLLAKWDPKRYGDKQLIGSDPDNPLPAGFKVELVKK